MTILLEARWLSVHILIRDCTWWGHLDGGRLGALGEGAVLDGCLWGNPQGWACFHGSRGIEGTHLVARLSGT